MSVVKTMCRKESGKHSRITTAELAMFWDYDTLWGTDTNRSPSAWRGSGALEFDNTEQLLDLHEAYGIRACFAVVGAAALPGGRPYHDPAQVRRIHAAGHEIASHSFRHEWLPALAPKELRDTLRDSRDALEQCIGAPVRAFVPPYNRPFDYPARLAFSISERIECGRVRTDVVRLCEALRETGYEFCRLGYRSLYLRLADTIMGHQIDSPGQVESVAGVSCVRLNAPCGFAAPTTSVIERYIDKGRLAVVYGHPHSLTAENSQNRAFLQPFLAKMEKLRRAGVLRVVTPSDLLEGAVA